MKTAESLRRTGLAIVVFVAAQAAMLNAATVAGEASEVASNIQHPNGNIYDQVLLQGVSATITADAGQVTRISFIDLNDDIVQVEFSGSGTLAVTLENASGPAVAAKYDQPDVRYMRGHASITIAGSDATTNVGAFSVGPCTAFNQALFPTGTSYDGLADIARLTIVADPANPGGTSTFGGIRTGNVHYFASQGSTGIVASNVDVQTVVIIGDVSAFTDAVPHLRFGAGSQFGVLTVAGGDLLQPNGRAIGVSGFQQVNMTGGRKSNCVDLVAQPNRGELRQDVITTTVAPAGGNSL